MPAVIRPERPLTNVNTSSIFGPRFTRGDLVRGHRGEYRELVFGCAEELCWLQRTGASPGILDVRPCQYYYRRGAGYLVFQHEIIRLHHRPGHLRPRDP